MKRGAIWILLTCLALTSLISISCAASTPTTTSAPSSPTSKSVSTPAPSTLLNQVTIPTSTTTSVSTGKWWDKLGKPQYGGEMVLALNRNIESFDPYLGTGFSTIIPGYMEALHGDDWTMDPAVFSYRGGYRPADFTRGFLAEIWEFTDSNTYVIHLRQGIHWQNISPVNGREFTSDDVVYHYNRMLGLGSGFTKVSPYYASVAAWQDLISVTPTDKYSVVFKWKTPNPELIAETLQASDLSACIEAREAVQQWGDLND